MLDIQTNRHTPLVLIWVFDFILSLRIIIRSIRVFQIPGYCYCLDPSYPSVIARHSPQSILHIAYQGKLKPAGLQFDRQKQLPGLGSYRPPSSLHNSPYLLGTRFMLLISRILPGMTHGGKERYGWGFKNE